jgi:hypothetical protein
MTWVRIDDAFADHPKIVQAGSRAAWLDVAAMCWSSRHLTDGFIPAKQVRRLTDEPNPDELAQALVDAGLWETRPDGFLVHDYLDYNPSAKEVRAQREYISKERSRAGKAGMESRWGDNKPITNAKQTDNKPLTPVPIPGMIEREKEDLELDEPTTRLAAAFQCTAGRPPSASELAQLSQLDATPAEFGAAVQVAVDRKANNLLPYALVVLADHQAGKVATQAARNRQPAPQPRPAPEPNPLADLWKTTLSDIQLQTTKATFDRWLRGTTPVERHDHTITIMTQDPFAKEWIENRLRTLIERTLASIAGEEMHLQVTTSQKGTTS